MNITRKIIIPFLLSTVVLYADIEVISAPQSSLPNTLSPSNYANMSANYDNMIANYDNMSANYNNMSANYDNMSTNYNNSSGNRKLLIKKDGSYINIGYYVKNPKGLVNFFTSKGKRLFYSPPTTDAIFDATSGDFSGGFASLNGATVLVITEKGQISLVKNGETAHINTSNSSTDNYLIDFAQNDEIFIINGEKFEAKSYCMGWDVGDSIAFLEGSPNGVCVSAELFNINKNRKCAVWCE